MATEAMHVPIPVGDTTIGEQDSDLVQSLGRMRPEVPHHLRALEIALGQTFLSMDKVGKLQWITNEEHRRVVTDDVPIAFFGIELQGETAWVALGIRRTALATHRGKPQKGWRLLANRLEQLGARVLADIPGDGKGAVSTRALSMYAAFRDILAVEVRELFNEVEIFEQQGATGAHRTRILVIGNGSATGSGQCFTLAH
ncbi:hypothetical protein D9M71_499070 [compost metagenome]